MCKQESHAEAANVYEQGLLNGLQSSDIYNNLGRQTSKLTRHRQQQQHRLLLPVVSAGFSYTALGRTEDGRAAYRKSLQLDASNLHAWNNWGHSLQQAGRHAEALHVYKLALDANPDNARCYFSYGRALQDQG